MHMGIQNKPKTQIPKLKLMCQPCEESEVIKIVSWSLDYQRVSSNMTIPVKYIDAFPLPRFIFQSILRLKLSVK